MAGKAPLLLACVLFAVGVLGLAITSAERAEWGPFEPHARAPQPRHVVVFNVPRNPVEPPSLHEFWLPQETALASTTSALVQSVEPEATPTPLSPLRVHGISADDAGVAAAGTTPTPPPPVHIGNVGTDSEPPPEEGAGTGTPEAGETPEEDAAAPGE